MARNRTRNKNKNTNIKPSVPNHKYGLLPVNNLTYGNPNAEQNLLIQKEGTFDYIATYFMEKLYPNNDGEFAKKELGEISQEMTKLQHQKVVELSVKFDEDLRGMMVETAHKCGVDNPTKFVQELMDDIDSIIMKLKFFYNRIRPFQLANVYGYALNPMPTVSSQSPSYPSGHTIQSRVFADILSFKYPDQHDMLDKFADKCSKSRIILGVHFPSDEVFGLQVATGIVRDKHFKEKYLSAQKVNQSNLSNQANQDFDAHNRNHYGGEVFGGMPQKGVPEVKVPGEDESGVFGGLPVAPQGNPMQHIKR